MKGWSTLPPLSQLLLLLLLALASLPAQAQYADIDYLGYGWETGGFPPSEDGDVLVFTGVADLVDPVFGVDLSQDELSFHAYDLVGTGEVDIGGGYTMIAYAGGMLDIYLDDTPDADWGIDPPNATSPSTFTDGILFFRGSFLDFAIYMAPDGSGSYEGHLDGLAGQVLDDVCADCVYTWGGAFAPAAGAQIPQGYDLQMDGVFQLDEAVADRPTTWGAVKSLYGN